MSKIGHAATAVGDLNPDFRELADSKFAQGTGYRAPGNAEDKGVEGKILAAKWARQNKVPYLGLCLGMQVMCIEFARLLLDSDEPNSTEFDATTEHPVISLMPDQHKLTDTGGTMRLGAYSCKLNDNSLTRKVYGSELISERHRHRFEFNNKYLTEFEDNGMSAAGINPDSNLVEVMEIKDHPWFIGVQFHPEYKSTVVTPHPLFVSFVNAVLQEKNKANS